MKIFGGLLLTVFLSVVCFSQNKKSVSKLPPKQPAIEIEATTKDGKNVILSSDGTWRYSISQTTSSSQNGKIELEAALIYRSGDVKPVARTDFFLLPDKIEKIIGTPELVEILKSDVKKNNLPDRFADTSDVDNLVSALRNGILFPTYSKTAAEVLSKAVQYKITTDFNGKAILENIPAGHYILFGMTPTQRSFAFWNMDIEVGSLSQHIILDQNNAARAY